MAKLDNPRHEKFCREYVIDVTNQAAAAIRAGYSAKTAAQQASRLLTKANIAARVAELQAEAAERSEVTVDNVIAKLAELRDAAAAAKQFGPAARCEELRGKTLGMFVDTKRDETAKMTDEAMVEAIRQLAGDDAAAKAMQRLRDSDPSVKTVH